MTVVQQEKTESDFRPSSNAYLDSLETSRYGGSRFAAYDGGFGGGSSGFGGASNSGSGAGFGGGYSGFGGGASNQSSGFDSFAKFSNSEPVANSFASGASFSSTEPKKNDFFDSFERVEHNSFGSQSYVQTGF